MGFKKKMQHLKRYQDLAVLLIKYGRSDIARKIDAEAHKDVEYPHDPKAEQLPDDLEKLGPTYVKLGQFLSTRADFLPPEYLDALTRLQDNVKPIPTETVERIITTELGIRISKSFKRFDRTPLASASLGQVHYAQLLDGREVAVKVQRPDIRDQMMEDLDAFHDLAEFLENHTDIAKKVMLIATLEEFRKSLIRELDYRQEAHNLRTLAENLKEFDHLVVPLPIDDYTTSRVLTMQFISGKNAGNLSPLARLEIDGEALAEELFRAYLQQILVDGFYHADPHPGNIFLTEDGKIALIDLGMVGRISEDLQSQLIRLLVAISEGKPGMAAKLALQIGIREGEGDDREFHQKVSDYIAEYTDATLNQMEVGRLVLEFAKLCVQNGVRLPNEFIMLGKTLLNLDKVGRTLDNDFDPNASLRRNSAEIVRKNFIRNISPGNLYETLFDTKEFLENLPRRINSILQLLAENRFTIQAKVIDEEYFIGGLKEAANRLTLGLVFAALIIGAALLMDVQTDFTIFGYPGIAMVFFILAALGGLFLAVRILFLDKDKHHKDKFK